MRTLPSALAAWTEIKQYSTLADLKRAVRLNIHSSAASTGLRSVFWKAFLLHESVDTNVWAKTLASSRSAYNSLRLHFLRGLEDAEEVGFEDGNGGGDPLGGGGDDGPQWTTLRKDEELRAEILQDIERCLPEMLYFRHPDTQRTMLDILFIFCKLNPDIGYRQGMHELLAPILWVVKNDAIELGERDSKAMGEDAIVSSVLSKEYMEHDSFALFGQVMHSAKNFYEQTTHQGGENPIVRRSQRIFDELLPLVDKALAQHMKNIDIAPQVFILRWVRLLFGREFPFDDVLNMWDVIFAEDSSLEIVDWICVVMLLRIRFELMEADYNMALTLLLRYPPLDRELSPQAFVTDALYLRDHADAEGGGYMVLKYTGRPLPPTGGSTTPPALQRNITTFTGGHPSRTSSRLSPSRQPRQQRNLEAMLQSTAQNIFARGEKLGLGVRNAVDEVHKKALEMRDSQQAVSASPRANWRTRDSQTSAETLRIRLRAQQERNKQLSKLLGGAMGDLWDYQKLVTERRLFVGGLEEGAEEDVDRLSLAIARVQFVQVYLDDSSLPLPEEDTVLAAGEVDAGPESVGEGRPSTAILTKQEILPPDTDGDGEEATITQDEGALADPSTFEDYFAEAPPPPATTEEEEKEEEGNPVPNAQPNQREKAASTERPLTNGPPAYPAPQSPESQQREEQFPRPSLDQSSFSWMLGPENPSSKSPAPPANLYSSSFQSSKKQEGGKKGFLFGDDVPTAPEEITVTPSRRGKRGKHVVTTTEAREEDVFGVGREGA